MVRMVYDWFSFSLESSALYDDLGQDQCVYIYIHILSRGTICIM